MLLLNDIKLTFRNLTKKPAFSAIIIATLALGIGGNTAILTAAHNILYATLPFPHSEQLVRIQATNTGPTGVESAFNLRGAEIFELWQQGEASPFSALLAATDQNRTLTNGATAELVRVGVFYGAWESVLAVKPILGRWFSADEQKRGDQSGSIVISSAVWNQRFGRDAGVIGKSLELDHRNHIIVGVMPDGFHFPYSADAWTPTTMVLRSVDDYAVFGRLKPGVSLAVAAQAVSAASNELVRRYPAIYSIGVKFKLQGIQDSLVGESGRPAITLAATAGFFLMLASFNVAGLLIARSVTRRTEVQIRLALGASRWQLIRGNLAETLVYSLLGGSAGLILATQIDPHLAGLLPSVFTQELGMTATGSLPLSLVIVAALCIWTCLAAGLLPAIASASTKSDGVDRARAASGQNRRERFWMDCFVTLEFIIALALLAGAGLMLRNFTLLAHRDLGIDAAHLLAIHVSTTDPRYATPAGKRTLADQLVRAAVATPGVSTAGLSTVNPLGGTTWTAPVAIERLETPDRLTTYAVNHRLITPRTLDALGVHLLQGRQFSESDDASAPGVAIVSRRMAQKYWPGQDALGKRVRVNRPNQPWLSVIGVVSDVNDFTDRLGPRETWYLPYAQNAQNPAASDVVLMVRAAEDPRAVQHSVEESIHASNKDLALYDSAAMDHFYIDSLKQKRLGSVLIAVLAGFGLLLGALGIYGTLAFSVGERVPEIGIRMALGSGRVEILSLIMKQGLRLSLIATVFGLGAAWAMGRLLASQLSEVRPGDPFVMFGAAAVLLLVAALAIYAPARRASRLDPMRALRRE